MCIPGRCRDVVPHGDDFMGDRRSMCQVCRDEAFASTPRPPIPYFGTNASSLRDVSHHVDDSMGDRVYVPGRFREE